MPGIGLRVQANTAIKFAGGVSDKDARALAPDMRCRPEFITAQRKHADHTTFAAYVRNVTPTALALGVPFGTVGRLPKMPVPAHTTLRERNRQRYAVSSAAAPLRPSAAVDQLVEKEDDWNSGSLSG